MIDANVLVEALPYVKEYSGQIVVVKYGGNAMIDEDLKAAVIKDVTLLNLLGVHVVLVHGGGPEINEWLHNRVHPLPVLDLHQVLRNLFFRVVLHC